MPCYAIDGVIPVVSPKAYVHPTAVLIGDVIVEAGAYIGPFAALRAEIGENSIIGANSTVKAKARIPENSLALGSPARVIRSLAENEIAWKTKGTEEYIQLTARCLNSMHEVEPLSENSTERLTYKHFASQHVIKSNR